ncbi:MAG TPA: serine/threonine protein kinase [Polyangiaceae bacterium]|nr:serine/threonine protein kinase [Polyangiaceae bacterium]
MHAPSDRKAIQHTVLMLEALGVVALDETLPALDAEGRRGHAHAALLQLDVAEDGAEDASYALGPVIGEGGMGVVHLAHERSLGREVAIKRLRPELRDNEVAATLLVEEAMVTGALEHPNVVPIHAVGADQSGQPLMVMKRLDGVSWRRLLAEPEHPRLDEVADPLRFHLEVLMQVCNALHYAHSRGVVHRDVKPENVVVGSYGEVYLLDWGAAFVPSRHRASEAIVGTLAYMAPEMLRGSGDFVTPRTDVYLLGATLHEVLTGSPPHAAETIDDAVLSIHRSGAVIYPVTVPAELAQLCVAAMNRDVDLRPESASSFKDAIERYLDHRGSHELAAAATDRLRQLVEHCGAEDVDGAVVTRLYIECTFGFRQALSSWQQNEAAIVGLQRCGEAMLRFELDRKNLEGARATLEQLPKPSPELAAAVDDLAREREAEGREVERLRDIARQQDPTTASGARASSAVVTGVVLAALFVALAEVYPEASGLSHRTIVYVTVSLGVALVGGAYAMRESLLATRVNRYLSAAVFAITATCALVHVAGDLMSAPVAYGLVADLLVSGAVVATVGLNLHTGLVVVGGVYLAGAVAAGLFPTRVLEVMALVFLVSHVVVAFTWRRLGATGNV